MSAEIRSTLEDWVSTCPHGAERIAFIAWHAEGTNKLNITSAINSRQHTLVALFKSIFEEDVVRAAAILALTGGPHAS